MTCWLDLSSKSSQVPIWCPLRRGTNQICFILNVCFGQNGRSISTQNAKGVSREDGLNEQKLACYEISSVMSAFPNTGRSDWWILAVLSGCFRPIPVSRRVFISSCRWSPNYSVPPTTRQPRFDDHAQVCDLSIHSPSIRSPLPCIRSSPRRVSYADAKMPRRMGPSDDI